MEILKLPIDNHFVLITAHGFSTFSASPQEVLVIHDLPLRYLINVCNSDPTDQQLIRRYNDFMNKFKFNAMKFFGSPVLHEYTLKEVLARYELPIQDHIKKHNEKNQFEIQQAVAELHLPDFDYFVWEIEYKKSPLFIFTRNGRISE